MGRTSLITVGFLILLLLIFFSFSFLFARYSGLQREVTTIREQLYQSQSDHIRLQNRVDGWRTGKSFILNVKQPIDNKYKIGFVGDSGDILIMDEQSINGMWVTGPMTFVLVESISRRELARIRTEPKGGDFITVHFSPHGKSEFTTYYVSLATGGDFGVDIEHFYK